MRHLIIALTLSAAGCAEEIVEERQAIVYPAAPLATPMALVGSVTPAEATIPVLESHHSGRPTEVVGILDIHVPVGGHEAALAELRARAAAMGADEVVGAEFHHGDGSGEPLHVSGLAVRYLTSPLP